MKKNALLALIVISLVSCEKFSLVSRKYGLNVKNVSNETLVLILGYEYPNIILPITPTNLLRLPPNEHVRIESNVKWKERINNLPADTLLLFAINVDTFDKYGYDVIRNTGNYICFKKIASSDLQYDTGGEITYP